MPAIAFTSWAVTGMDPLRLQVALGIGCSTSFSDPSKSAISGTKDISGEKVCQVHKELSYYCGRKQVREAVYHSAHNLRLSSQTA